MDTYLEAMDEVLLRQQRTVNKTPDWEDKTVLDVQKKTIRNSKIERTENSSERFEVCSSSGKTTVL